MTPTAEQDAITFAAKKTADNILVRALAGAAKTSTLVLIAKALGSTPILAICFNKKIQLEMQDRLPGNCTSKTLNSIGNTAWKDFIGRHPSVDPGKTYRILKTLIEELEPAQKKLAYEGLADLIRAVDSGKTAGYIPTNSYPAASALMDDDEFFAWLDDEPSQLDMDLIRAASLISLKEAHQGVIDYNDQILCAAVFPCSFPQFPVVLVDEAQDLSSLNHVMLRKLVRKRLIAVGDECQAIYGFRGAHENSMTLLKKEFSMVEFTLTISFRCPISVVEAARWRAPAMQYPEWAKPGEVRHLPDWNAKMLPPEAAIICRNNAPLFNAAIKLLKNGRYPELVGNDIGKALIKILKKLGKDDLPRDKVLGEIDGWEIEKLEKSRSPSKVRDQAECLRIFARQGKNLGDAVLYAETIFNASGPIKLMTGHKSKGLEFEDVFFLDEFLIGDEQQEKNLKYVIQTRSKSTLTYINSETFVDNEDLEEENV